jgi:hypothetical protein
MFFGGQTALHIRRRFVFALVPAQAGVETIKGCVATFNAAVTVS